MDVSSSLKVEVVTPERMVFSSDVNFLVVPGVEGELGILHNHIPLVAGLDIGVIRAHEGDVVRYIAISGGFLEVENDKAMVLAEAAEMGLDIDVQRAEAAKRRAEERLANRRSEINELRAHAALKRSLVRLKAAEAERSNIEAIRELQQFSND